MVRKEEVKKFLDEIGEKYKDEGNLSFDPGDDAIEFVRSACKKMAEADKGVFFCGSGVMVDIVANRFPNIRSCLAVDPDQVKAARQEDDANVLCLGTDSFGAEDAKRLVGVFLETIFSGEEKYRLRIKRVSGATDEPKGA